MSHLVPGYLFTTPGLNRKNTPTPRSATSDDLDKIYTREPFNGRPWPSSSPVSGVYDIRNTSTQLILINNRKRKESQLRGKSNPRKEEHRYPEPERHSRCSTPVNKEHHTSCLDSSSPYYEPEIDLNMEWLNRSQRPPNRFAAGSAVNPKRHTSCQVPSDPRPFDIRIHSPRNRPNSRTSLPVNFGRGQYRDLTPGEQRYFASISRVYSNNQMVRLKRRQYIDLLNQELAKGLYTKQEYMKYRDYICLGRQRQYLQIHNRAMSAPVRRSVSRENDTNRSISSISGDDKSSVSERRDRSSRQNSPEKRQEPKRSSTPNKRPASVNKIQSKKTAQQDQSSPEKSSRAGSAKSTSSVKNVKVKSIDNETKEEQKDTESLKNDSKCDVKQENETYERENDAVDSDSNVPAGHQYSAREGHDRPKSRLGHIPEHTTENKNEEELTDNRRKLNDGVTKSDISEEKVKLKSNSTTTQDNKELPTEEKRSIDSSSSSDEEEKDPDKLQY